MIAEFGDLRFSDPLETYAPATLAGALDALARVDQALENGYWIAGALSYELGASLYGIEPRPSTTPLLRIGVFRPPSRSSTERGEIAKIAAPLSRVDPADYERNVREILERINDGDVYEVNYTVPFDIAFAGEPRDMYQMLQRSSAASYAAFLECDDLTLASLSPELFLRFDGDRITTKPMKGTAAPGDISALHNEKNRAEHLMIVDLLRNDLHRLAKEVRVERLFEVERYPTFATLTSTISATLSRKTPLSEIIRAMFPCGSITGAPKLAAMRCIHELEPQARGFYTGSIGFLSPERGGWWNVAIRTLQFTRGAACARFDAGGGIVSDSQPDDEWNEVLLKSHFLRPAIGDFALLETFGRASNLDAHMARLARSAKLFGIPFNRAAVKSEITRVSMPSIVRTRLSLDGSLSCHGEPVEPGPSEVEAPVQICLSTATVRSDDPMLRHKTSWRPAHEIATREAKENDCFDALLRNERGEITEGSRTNVFVEIDGKLYTPRLSCGLLPGVLRAQLLAEGTVVERAISEADVLTADALFIGNSARGLLRAQLIRSLAPAVILR